MPIHPAPVRRSAFCALAFAAAWTMVPASAAAQTSWKFSFGETAHAGFLPVSPSSAYADSVGYGFDFGTDTVIRYSAQKDGIEGAASVRDTTLASWAGDPFYLPARQAFFFSARVPRGNYEVKITLGSADSAVRATIRAEQRRLMIEDWQIPAGKTETRTIHVNRGSDTIAGTTTLIGAIRQTPYADLDDRLTIEFNGNHPVVDELEITKLDTDITVYLAGASTTNDQPEEPYGTWGMYLPRFLKPGVAVSNQAETGMTAESFISSQRLANIVSTLKAGDYVFVEFGHNDARVQAATANFSSNLAKFVTAAKSKGATPIFVTPTARNSFTGAKASDFLLDSFVVKMKTVAAAQGVDLVDLNALSSSFIEALYPNQKTAYAYFPAHTVLGQDMGLSDGTHWNDYGGYELAKGMATLIKRKDLGLAKFLSDDYVDFDPAVPDSYSGFALPFGPRFSPPLVPDSCGCSTPDGVAVGKAGSSGATRFRGVSLRNGVLVAGLNGSTEGVQVRVVDLDGSVLATGLTGPDGRVRMVLPQGRALRVRVVEIVRRGQILDQRRVLSEL